LEGFFEEGEFIADSECKGDRAAEGVEEIGEGEAVAGVERPVGDDGGEGVIDEVFEFGIFIKILFR
jgi:hypothetical protein